ncbi:MAG TPA: hypothetical protein VHU87_15135 [Rhizomicrobium sp.]|jgi:uncharacterized PurR-regulated membrane protein YhhQ (DUF165 family)|nr:hypothetical protein [Rhizomicrobium sp.]
MADASMGSLGGVHAGRARSESLSGRIAGVFGAGLRLIVPVALLLVTGAAAFLYSNVPVTWLTGPGDAWLTMGQVLLPVTFLAVHLTNRRYGPAYAAAQVVLAGIVGIAAFQAVHSQIAAMAGLTLPSARETFGFGLGLLLAQLSSVFVFDRTRGPRWWSGPLFASLWAAMVLCFVSYPAAYAGTDADWINHMFVNLWLAAGAGVVLLIPYWMCRAVVQPLSGFNGY